MARPNQNNNTGNRRAPVNHGRSKDIQKRKPVEEKQGGIVSRKKTKKTSTKEFVIQIPVLGQYYGIGRKGTNTADTASTTNTRHVTRNKLTSTANTTNDDENVCMICFVFVLITSQ